ncbi:endonuclease/exonuclease/phosphatase family protein [Luedemannella helvata]|uniref:Endonuclease/exonuclease/phosphatase family protein n=1 Tax=Luedemannella helvata TaxID=349315 RepID=A0ABN2KA08_9ACTN
MLTQCAVADPPTDVPPPRRRWSRVLTGFVWVCVAPVAVWALVRTAGWEYGTLAVKLVAFTPYVAAGAVLVALIALGTRRWWAAGTAVVAVVALACGVLPRFFADADAARPAAPGPDVVFMSVNVLAGRADMAQLVGLVRERRVDVLAIQEFTPGTQRRLAGAGLEELLPHKHTTGAAGVSGSGLYSRYPLSGLGVRMNPGGFRQVYATVAVPGARPVYVESVHPVPPHLTDSADGLLNGLAGQPAATPDGPVRVLIGDFNSTLDHAALRRLLGRGYRDAAATVGEGLTPTWPYYGRRVPVTPKVTIDHVLADERIGVRDFAAVTVRRTDHRALFATLVLPGP